MNLPNDIARCDGLLPMPVRLLNGQIGRLWMNNCPQRDGCARHRQMERDDYDAPVGTYHYAAHGHSPEEACSGFIAEGGE